MALQQCPECGREISTKAGACPHCGNPGAGVAGSGQPAKPKKRRWLIKGLLIFVGFLFLMSAISNYSTKGAAVKNGSSSAQRVASEADPKKEQRFEECRSKLKKAQKLDLLHDLDWKSGSVKPRVVVGPTFYRADFSAKQAFAKTVNCFLMGGSTDVINFDLLDWRTEKRVARFKYGELKMN